MFYIFLTGVKLGLMKKKELIQRNFNNQIQISSFKNIRVLQNFAIDSIKF